MEKVLIDSNERLESLLKERAREYAAVEVRAGLGYTAVKLDDGSTGVAFTFHQHCNGECTLFHGKRPLSGRSAADLLSYVKSADPIEAAVGLAAANAVITRSGVKPDASLDVLDFIRLRRDDRVGMVGFFGPLVQAIKQRVESLFIFDQNAARGPGISPAEDALQNLPECSAALITSTSIMNGTLTQLLNAAKNCREIVLLGASTPMLPEAFVDTPVTCLSGVIVREPDMILQIVSEAGGMRFFKKYVEKINIRLK